MVNIQVKGKVVPVLNQATCQDGTWGSGGIALHRF